MENQNTLFNDGNESAENYENRKNDFLNEITELKNKYVETIETETTTDGTEIIETETDETTETAETGKYFPNDSNFENQENFNAFYEMEKKKIETEKMEKMGKVTLDETSIFETGVLISIHLSAYNGTSKLSANQLNGLPPEIVRGVYDLFDNEFKSLLKKIVSHDNKTRNFVKVLYSIPFPIDGVYFIRSENMGTVINYLDERTTERETLISVAVENYENAIQVFAMQYPEYYESALQKRKYISKELFKSKFSSSYQFFTMSVPNKQLEMISPETYKRELEKLRGTIDEMKRDVVNTIYTELLEKTKRLKLQCETGKPSQRTLNNLNLFMERIDAIYSDFVDRNDIMEIVKNVRSSILGIDADSLRNDETVKTDFKREMVSAIETLENLPDADLKRSIDF